MGSLPRDALCPRESLAAAACSQIVELSGLGADTREGELIPTRALGTSPRLFDPASDRASRLVRHPGGDGLDELPAIHFGYGYGPAFATAGESPSLCSAAARSEPVSQPEDLAEGLFARLFQLPASVVRDQAQLGTCRFLDRGERFPRGVQDVVGYACLWRLDERCRECQGALDAVPHGGLSGVDAHELDRDGPHASEPLATGRRSRCLLGCKPAELRELLDGQFSRSSAVTFGATDGSCPGGENVVAQRSGDARPRMSRLREARADVGVDVCEQAHRGAAAGAWLKVPIAPALQRDDIGVIAIAVDGTGDKARRDVQQRPQREHATDPSRAHRAEAEAQGAHPTIELRAPAVAVVVKGALEHADGPVCDRAQLGVARRAVGVRGSWNRGRWVNEGGPLQRRQRVGDVVLHGLAERIGVDILRRLAGTAAGEVLVLVGEAERGMAKLMQGDLIGEGRVQRRRRHPASLGAAVDGGVDEHEQRVPFRELRVRRVDDGRLIDDQRAVDPVDAASASKYVSTVVPSQFGLSTPDSSDSTSRRITLTFSQFSVPVRCVARNVTRSSTAVSKAVVSVEVKPSPVITRHHLSSSGPWLPTFVVPMTVPSAVLITDAPHSCEGARATARVRYGVKGRLGETDRRSDRHNQERHPSPAGQRPP